MPRSEITGGYIDAAIPFIDKAAADKKPFYINLWPWVDKWAGDKRGVYLSVLTEMER